MILQSDGVQRFSLRKGTLGATSVLLGTMVCLVGAPVYANELGVSETTVVALNAEETLLTDEESNMTAVEESVAQESVITDVATDTVTEEVVSDNPISLSVDEAWSENEVKPAVDLTAVENNFVSDDVKFTDEETAVVTPGSSFRRARHASGALGDDYPQVWKNGIIWKSVDNWNMYVKECVSFAAFRLSSVNGFELPRGYGNANTWGHIARRAGYRVDMTPAVGAIAWTDSNQHGAFWAGHVAWVSHVDGDKVEIEEYNYNNNHAYNRRVISRHAVSGYIHFKDLSSPAVSQPSKPATTDLAPSGTYHFTKYAGIKAEPKLSSPDLAHYTSGYSVNYDSVIEADGHQWISYVSYSGNRRYIAVAPVKAKDVFTGKVSVTHTNAQEGTFDIVVSNVSATKSLKAVKLGVWTKANGQDDLMWYTASRQANGDYKASVSIAQHGNQRGDYGIQLQYVTTDRQKVAVTETTTTVETVRPATPSLPPRGTYYFTQRASIKAEPKQSSPELAYYDLGYSVNYDSIVTSEGRQWLSYLSYAGNRRYIALP